MPLSVVKATKFGASTGTSTVATALTATAGNALIVGGSAFVGNNASGVSASRTGDTYTVDIQGKTAGGATANSAFVISAPNVAAAAADLTVSDPNANGIVGFAVEVNGTPSSAIRDASSPAVLTGNSTTPDTNSLTNATADAIFFGDFSDESGADQAVTVGTGWTDVSGAVTTTETNGAQFPVCGLEWKIVSAVGAQTAPWTIAAAQQWAGAIAVYKATVAAAVPLARNQVILQAVKRLAFFFRALNPRMA